MLTVSQGFTQVWLNKTKIGETQFNYRLDSTQLSKYSDSMDESIYKSLFSIHIVENDFANEISVEGVYTLSGAVISFRPYFELNPMLEFQVNYGIDSLRFSPSRKRIKRINTPSKVIKVYPNSTDIPENILTFYVEFDQPMLPIESAYKNIDIINSIGEKVPIIWRQRSFWINENRTLVLMIHPGRVKTGIRSTEMLKPHFNQEDRITLVVNPGLITKDGGMVISKFMKEYRIVSEDQVVPKSFVNELRPLKSGTRDPIIFIFGEAIDFGLLQKWLKIQIGGEEVPGVFSSDDDITWIFIPEKEWEQGSLIVELYSKLGDLCHNQIDRLFEINELSEISPPSKLSFQIKIIE